MTHGDYLLEQPTLFRQLLLFHYCTRPVININLYLNTDPYIRRKYCFLILRKKLPLLPQT